MFLCVQTSMPKGREGVFLTFVCSLNTSQGSAQHQVRARYKSEGDGQALPSRSSQLVGKAPRSGEAGC